MANVNYGFEDDNTSVDQIKSSDGIQLEDTSVAEAAPTKASSFKEHRGFCARWFYSPVTFTIILVIWTILKASSQGYASSTITTIEKRFRLKSTHIGYFSVVEDVIGLSTVMFITHFGQSRHRPRVIGFLALTVAFGITLRGIPHFLYKLPTELRAKVASPNSSYVTDMVCLPGGTDESQVCTPEEEAAAGALLQEAFWLPLGSSVISLGGAIPPISITYLDDNVSRTAMPVYAGVVFSVFVFGSIFGFFLAGFTLSLPVTLLSSDPDYYNAEPTDANWLGAWWLGYFICSFLLAVFGAIFCLFPRQLRDPEELAKENEAYVNNNPIPEAAKVKHKHDFEHYSGIMEFFKDFIISLKHIVSNVVVMCLIVAGCFTALTSSVFMTFGPKFLSVVYGLDPVNAAISIGAFLIPGAFLGQIIGGVIIRQLKLNRYGLAMVALATGVIMILGFFVFFIVRCDERAVAGLTVPYPGTTSISDNVPSVCNENCGCPEGQFNPVCGEDGITYVTPCHAGCSRLFNNTYYDCTCISSRDGLPGGMATKNQCEVPCGQFIFYILVTIPISFLGTFGGIAGFMLQLRSVDEAHRGLAMSFGNVLIRILGYIPGPIMTGFVIERTCVLYQRKCGVTGNCDYYDSHQFLIGFDTVLAVATVIGTGFIVAVFLYIRHHTPKNMRHYRIKDTPGGGKTEAYPLRGAISEIVD